MSFDDKFLVGFNSRFHEFRAIEASVVIGKSNCNSSGKAFSLLYDMELCYSAKAYYACLIIACTAIESILSHELGEKDNLKIKIEKSGYKNEADWLRLLRNEIVHGKGKQIIHNMVHGEIEEELKKQCRNAFKIVHTMHFNPIKEQKSSNKKINADGR